MPTEITYSYARQHLARILETAAESQERVIISRRGHKDMAVISAEELRSLEAAAHLLRSRADARRHLTAVNRALRNADNPVSDCEPTGEADRPPA
jgi:antitoxin YefM